MNDVIILAALIGVIIFTIFILIFLYGSLKNSSECSKEEEQEEAIRRLNGKEYKLDDYNLEDDLVYDDDFVKKEVENE